MAHAAPGVAGGVVPIVDEGVAAAWLSPPVPVANAAGDVELASARAIAPAVDAPVFFWSSTVVIVDSLLIWLDKKPPGKILATYIVIRKGCYRLFGQGKSYGGGIKK